MQAIILAGGFGTRLRSVVVDLPKPMAPICGKPFLAYLIDYLKEQGVTEIVLSVHYMHEKIQQYFQSSYNGIKIQYAIEEQPLGSGGAIMNSLPLINPSRPVFVLNGDTFLKLDYKKMAAIHHSAITMALRTVSDTSRYGLVLMQNNIVAAFQERGGVHSGLINAGVYLINPNLFDNYFSKISAFSFEKDFLFPHVQPLKPTTFIVDDYFIDIGIPEDYARAEVEFRNII